MTNNIIGRKGDPYLYTQIDGKPAFKLRNSSKWTIATKPNAINSINKLLGQDTDEYIKNELINSLGVDNYIKDQVTNELGAIPQDKAGIEIENTIRSGLDNYFKNKYKNINKELIQYDSKNNSNRNFNKTSSNEIIDQVPIESWKSFVEKTFKPKSKPKVESNMIYPNDLPEIPNNLRSMLEDPFNMRLKYKRNPNIQTDYTAQSNVIVKNPIKRNPDKNKLWWE